MSLTAISPIDGRYSSKTNNLSPFFSEKALMQYRIFTEINYLLLLSEENIGIRKITDVERNILLNLHNIADEEAEIIKKIETKGYKEIPATNHDVKAIEYFIKLKLTETSLVDVLEIVHFALTSEDVNNISYALMIRDGFNKIIFPSIIDIYDRLYKISVDYKDLSMLARTHGQPATPTTFGKEILVFVNRLKEEMKCVFNIPLLAKLNGATGNYNAHSVVFPNINWQEFTKRLINKLNLVEFQIPKYCKKLPLILEFNKVTTQIEPHDCLARLFDSVKRINNILIDFSQDMWRYISDNWIKQKPVKGEIGSSAMPHKVNPIDFENAEGNFGVANALFTFFSQKLAISRLQRDLTDSTVLRNIGVAFAHSLIAYQSLQKGLSKIEVDKDTILNYLNNNPEVMAEAYQNILRVEGVEKPYELLKEITRGKKVTIDDFHSLAKKLIIKEETKQRLLAITPQSYTGIANKIVEEFEPEIN